MKRIFCFFREKFKRLGPGFITGAADDDPSGVATYSIAGAQFGYKLNFLSLFLIPLMISIQEMCARIGMCSGMGLAGVIKKYYSKKLLYFAVLLLVTANTINIGADLGIMASCLELLFKLPYLLWLIVVTLFTVVLEIFIPYKKYSVYLRWLGLTLCVYIITAFIAGQNWREVIKYTFIPHIEFNLNYLMTMVGFIGTTISPYLFFWQASEEVEEEINKGVIKDFMEKPHINYKDILYMRSDTSLGMIFSNIISIFIVITTAATLFRNGITDIESPRQAALALKPLAGDFAFLLFTFGIIGIGLQSVPVLSGGIAYVISETFGFKEGLGKKLFHAKMFYLILALGTIIGAILNLIGINPIKALFYTAIINGIVSVPLIAIILKLSDDKRVVGDYKTMKINKILGYVALVFIGLSSLFMLIKLLIAF